MPNESEEEFDETVILNSEAAESPEMPSNDSDDTKKFEDSEASFRGRSFEAESAARPESLGRYRIERLLGQGGMGAVYLGVDKEDGRQVAVKVLSPKVVSDQDTVLRFQKEARLLAKVHHPKIVNLLEVGEDQGTCYLVLEYIEGIDLKKLLSLRKSLTERSALLIIRDVAEALSEAHQRGIVHRDIKPSNVLITDIVDPHAGTSDPVDPAIESNESIDVKLTDFGLAREINQSESLALTQTGQMLGTPIYMSPEQCSTGGTVGPGTDIYALGVMLFEMLAGKPPFVTDDAVKIISMHCFTDPPDLRKLNPDVSDATAALVRRMLRKSPNERFVDADHLLEDVDALLSGDATNVSIHPPAPKTDAPLFTASWEWDLQSAFERLWPLVSNTERVNCAVGIPSVEYTTDRDEFGALRKFGTFRLGWATMKWEEHPFEWIEGRRLGVLREFLKGPFEWFLSVVELSPAPNGGTRLTHFVQIAPRGLLGRLLAFLEVNVKGRKALDQVYERIDAVAAGRLKGSPAIDPFVASPRLSRSSMKRLDTRRAKLQEFGTDLDCEDALTRFIEESPSQELARIRPHAFARRMKLPVDEMTETCLRACQVGLLELHWDILCPTCRVSSAISDTLNEIEEHVYCEACDLDFEVDFGRSVELIFQTHPEVREADLRTYCIGGPEHAPHVVSQVRLATSERLLLDLMLDSGFYVLRGPQLPFTVRLNVRNGHGIARTQIILSNSGLQKRSIEVQAGRLLLELTNEFECPLLLRIERSIPMTDVVTASAARELPLFRELFPEEVVSPKLLSDVATSTLVAVRISNVDMLFDKLGDTAALHQIRSSLTQVQEAFSSQGGNVVSVQSDRLLTDFRDVRTAIKTVLELLSESVLTDQAEEMPALRIAMHRGTIMKTTIDGRSDYAGRTVNAVSALIESNANERLLLTDELFSDLDVQDLLTESGFVARKLEIAPVSGSAVFEVTQITGGQSTILEA